MKFWSAILAVLLIAACGFALAAVPVRAAVAVAIGYVAVAIFLVGLCWRVLRWARVPVPFRITTTCGQQRSLPWIKQAKLENPSSGASTVGRMLLEVLLFRSLFRNNRAEMQEKRLVVGEEKWLWLAALTFHWALLVVVIRHLRLLVEPVPTFVLLLQKADGFFQLGTPELYLSDVVLLAAAVALFTRRVRNPQVRFISLFTDYFALALIGTIAISGVIMRHFTKVDVAAVKQFALGLATFSPVVPANVGAMFFVHLLLVCALAVYFPFSKLVHMGGVFLSPTRNLANNNRAVRHVNPWNAPVKTHTYAEWEHEFRDKLEIAGLPVEGEHARTASAD